MIDRRLLTDIGLALLIALPSVLPAAPGPWSADDEAGKAESPSVATSADARAWEQAISDPFDLPG